MSQDDSTTTRVGTTTSRAKVAGQETAEVSPWTLWPPMDAEGPDRVPCDHMWAL